MVRERERERGKRPERAGSAERDSKHRAGGEWTTIMIPEGIEMFQPEEGRTYRFDIVPYVVGEGNPFCKKGLLYYERTFYTHRGVGPDNESYVCASKTAHQSCYVCDHRGKMARDPEGDEKLLKDLKPKERQLWLIRLRHKGEIEDKVKLWEFSFHNFGKMLDFKRNNAEEDELYKRDFDDPDGGATLKVTFVKETAGKTPYLKAGDIEFIPRPDGLEDEILDHGICLDKLIKVLPYDELKKIYLQIPDGSDPKDEEDEDRPTKSTKEKSKSKDDDDWDDKPKKTKEEPKEEKVEYEEGMKVRHRQFGVCEVMRVSEDGSLGLQGIEEQNEGKRFKGVDPKNVRPLQEEKKEKPKKEEDDDWDDKPAKSKSKAKEEEEENPPTKSRSSKPKKEEDDEWDKKEEKEEKTPKSTKKSSSKDEDDWD